MKLKEEVKGWEKRKNKEIKKFLLIILSLCFLLLNIVATSAADVAYIYKKNYKVDKNVLGVFDELGLSYELIDERYLPRDFSNYKLIFVGDERFNNVDKIPVDKKDSIIANYYFGEEFGLTDYDGVSKLAATAPLSVRKDNKIIQVYTQAKYNSISIPYYYLDDENKASGMQTITRTYTGNDKDYNFGDVISYANPKTKLINSRYTEGKLCFFGIIESDYWTSEARKLFKDCVGFVAVSCNKDSECGEKETGEKYCKDNKIYQDTISHICENPGTVKSECLGDMNSELVEECKDICENGECKDVKCYKDSDCDDRNDYTKDVCMNSGTPESYCQHIPLQCLKKSDCGIDNFIGDKYCQNNKVYQNYINFSCTENKCSNSTSVKLIENCIDICRNGECVERECTKDSDCAEDYYGDNYCMNNDSFHDSHDFSCQQEMCVENVTIELFDDCKGDEICIEGMCRGITCKKNNDCGVNRFLGWKYCKNGNSYENFISFTCFNPGTINSYCENYTLPILSEYCDFECVSGECITCFNNLSCGKDGFTGDKYCQDNSVYQNYQQFECVKPGTSESDCISEVFPKLIENCSDLCIDGSCVEIKCYKDSDCDDNDIYTIDECNNPGTKDSYCSNTKINCINNNDCGITGFTEKEYCYKEDVYKNYQNSTCINAGTKDSYCDVEKWPRFLIDCGEDECEDWQNYCQANQVWRNRSCYERGCEEGSCFKRIAIQKELVKECDYACESGECIGIHDVALIDFSNSIGGIRLEHINGTDILEDPAVLFCNNKYKVYIEIKNLGDYYENVSFNGEVDSLLFNHEPKNNLAPGDASLKYKTVNFTLPPGFYNITVEAIIPVDNVPENNFASREIKILCVEEPICGNDILEEGEECESNSDCLDTECDYLDGCYGRDYYNYQDRKNNCIECSCESNSCDVYNIIYNDSRCIKCGDSVIDAGEECDDGNNADGDGCSAECKLEITCYKNSDCGENGWLNQEYCKCTKEVWDYWQEFECVNAGASNIYCINTTTVKLKENCRENYCENWSYYCKGKEVWKNKTCYDKGCKNGACFINSFINETLVEYCAYGCESGECTGECEKDSDCAEDYYGDNYCMNNDSYRDLHDFSCVSGKCKEDVIRELVKECKYGCENNECTKIGGYSLNYFGRMYSGYGYAPWVDLVKNNLVVSESDKKGTKYWTLEGNWTPENTKTDSLKLNVNGEMNSAGKDPNTIYKAIYRILGDTKVNIRSKTWGNHGELKLDRIDIFQRESDTSILINGNPESIALGKSYQIERKTWIPPRCVGTNYNRGETYINVTNVAPEYFDVIVYVWEYDEECDSAYAKIESYVEKAS